MFAVDQSSSSSSFFVLLQPHLEILDAHAARALVVPEALRIEAVDLDSLHLGGGQRSFFFFRRFAFQKRAPLFSFCFSSRALNERELDESEQGGAGALLMSAWPCAWRERERERERERRKVERKKNLLLRQRVGSADKRKKKQRLISACSVRKRETESVSEKTKKLRASFGLSSFPDAVASWTASLPLGRS